MTASKIAAAIAAVPMSAVEAIKKPKTQPKKTEKAVPPTADLTSDENEAAAAEHDSREPCASIKELAAKHPKLTRIGWQPDSPQADADSATKLTAEDVYARLCRLGLRHPAPVSAQGVEVKTRAARFRTLAGLATP